MAQFMEVVLDAPNPLTLLHPSLSERPSGGRGSLARPTKSDDKGLKELLESFENNTAGEIDGMATSRYGG